MTEYTPHNWYWVVGGNIARAWSSAAGAYVDKWPADQVTRIATEQELSDVLRPHGLTVPSPTADDVRAECFRRIDAIYPSWKQDNANRLSGANLPVMAAFIDAHRAASNKMEAHPPVDFKNDKHWPATRS